MNLLLSEAIMNSQTDSNSDKKIQTRPQIRSIFGGTKICMCTCISISKNKTQSIVQRSTSSKNDAIWAFIEHKPSI